MMKYERRQAWKAQSGRRETSARTCPECGASLDAEEICDCKKTAREREAKE